MPRGSLRTLVFHTEENLGEGKFQRSHPQWGRQIQVGWENSVIFNQCLAISETVEDKYIVTTGANKKLYVICRTMIPHPITLSDL